jgi:hypothetical protein
MDVFPTCNFRLLLDGSALIAGQRNTGTVELELPEPIQRAEHVDFLFQSIAVAGYGSGKSRHVVQRAMFAQPLQVDVGPLRAGRHTFPFALDLPPWIPPAYSGNDCRIEHKVDLRLDVDWAIDPKASFAPPVRGKPLAAPVYRKPLSVRSPHNFHDAIAIEVTLDSSVIVQGEPLTGRVALRTGHAADFDAVNIGIGHSALVSMYRRDARPMNTLVVRIPAEALRTGQSVPFRFPAADLPASSRNGFLDITPLIEIALDVSWWRSNRTFPIALEVLPHGTRTLDGGGATALLGESRMVVLARDLASRTNSQAGNPPVLVYGSHGPIAWAVEDASRGSETAAREVHVFPNLGMHLRSRPLGILPVGSSLAPRWLADRFAIQSSTPVPAATVARFLEQILDDAGNAVELQFSDHMLGLRFRLGADDHRSWLGAVATAQMRARKLVDAITALPFAHEEARAAWTSTALEENAFLLPHLPAIVGIRRGARVASGEQREAVCTIATDEKKTRIEVDLDADLPAQAVAALHAGDGDELVRALRTTFESVDAPTPKHLTAVVPGFTPDPRTLLPGLDTMLAWSLHARGERRMDLPYR